MLNDHLSTFETSTSSSNTAATTTYNNGGGQVWNSVTQGVVNQAMNDWTAVLSGISNGGGSKSVTFNFNVRFANAGTNSYLGQWQGGFFRCGRCIDPAMDCRREPLKSFHRRFFEHKFGELALVRPVS